ncbi:methyl-accepting chemotaxis protein [Brevundimonas sp.]|uniref:methyl-accepting chemotaxis protein n=1 Tax=Brevundimonas sp. TaxID=1871086 RepID=UPI001D31103D|nr:methyl-accepting chemotaxis protein [Brevundimonas sp.]MBA3999735.1 chemotaxis protein [Brevundimonas sp.]
MNNIKIGQKLALAFAAVVLVIAAMGTAVFLNVLDIENARQEYSTASQGIRTTQEAQFFLARQENAYRGYLVSGDPYYIERLDTHRGVFKEKLDALRVEGAGHPEVLEQVDQIEAAADAWYVNVVEVGRALAADPATRAQAIAMVGREGVADTYISPAEDGMDVLIEAEEAILASARDHQTQAGNMANTVLIGGISLAALIAAGLGLLMTRTIAKPVVNMTAVMRKLAGGDKTVEVPGAGRKDEIGDMSAAVLAFKDAAIANDRLEGEAADQRRMTETERARAEAERAEAARQQAAVVDALAEGLEQLSKGNLTYRLTQTFPEDYLKLQSDFNAAMGQLKDAMTTVVNNVAAIRSGAGEISQASDDLSRRTEQQAASLEETAAALDQITATVRKTASGAKQCSDVVLAARGDAEKSGEIVRDAVGAMSAIEQSSTQISQIIGVIDEIAFQTNLLALNAGVEAARAGDAGRGFAVVASEVRALAQRSADAAKEIKTLISSSGTQVGAGVNLVGQTGEALNRIVERVAEIDGLITEISASAQEQATGLQQVNTAVNQMDQVTQQNAAMVEESTAASHSLAQEADALDQSVSRFQIEEQGRRASTPAPAPHKPAAKPSAVQRTVTALKAMGAGGAARKLETVAAEDGWEEF